MKALSLSGQDGSGKSQHIRLLGWDNPNLFHITRPLIEYNPNWPKLKGYAAAEWWFEKVSMDELASLIVEAINTRHRDSVPGKISVYDRGCFMFEAVCAATKMTREEVPLEAARKWARTIFLQKLDHQPEECEVVLIPSAPYFASVNHLLAVVDPPEDLGFPISSRRRYARYQDNLRAALSSMTAERSCHLVTVDAPIIEVQDRIRSVAEKEFDRAVRRLDIATSPIIGFGGLSECGKSSFAQHLATQHGFSRFKLRYFIEVVERLGKRTPELVVLEVIRFLRDHYYLERISLESLHDPYVPAMLKLLLGDRFRIVYIETDQEVRIQRAMKELSIDVTAATTLVIDKDHGKKERGAEVVRGIADLVFDNSSDRHTENLESFASQLLIAS